jgi:phosphatidate cytidylyltransferase
MSSLAKRALTAVVLIPLVVAVTLALPTGYFAAFMGILAVAGAWEWAAMAGWPSPLQRIGYCATLALVLVGIHRVMSCEAGTWLVLAGGLVWWLVALAWVVRFQQGIALGAFDSPWVRLLVGWLTLGPAWGALTHLHAGDLHGRGLVLLLLVIIWTADSAAYFVGRRFGARRLASRVSPGKSLEGLAGALLAVALLAMFAAELGWFQSRLGLLTLCLLTVMLSVLGDLTESVFKRTAGVKDSGTLVPGHGGVLDRIDSLSAAAPLFVLGYYWQAIVN